MGAYQRALRLWQSYQILSAADVDRVLDNFNVLFAYHSGKIENDQITYHDTREIFKHGKVSGYTGETKALFEQQNQKLCYEYLKEKIVARDELDTRLAWKSTASSPAAPMMNAATLRMARDPEN